MISAAATRSPLTQNRLEATGYGVQGDRSNDRADGTRIHRRRVRAGNV